VTYGVRHGLRLRNGVHCTGGGDSDRRWVSLVIKSEEEEVVDVEFDAEQRYPQRWRQLLSRDGHVTMSQASPGHMT
jgi:hypothetical protein